VFNVLAGVQFDSADGMNKYDTYTYLKDYYGEWGYVGKSFDGIAKTISQNVLLAHDCRRNPGRKLSPAFYSEY
jgi:hypothetical protein